MCLALSIVVIDNTILAVAIPEIAKHSRKLITDFSSEDPSTMEEWV